MALQDPKFNTREEMDSAGEWNVATPRQAAACRPILGDTTFGVKW